jgi:hypothetical protein
MQHHCDPLLAALIDFLRVAHVFSAAMPRTRAALSAALTARVLLALGLLPFDLFLRIGCEYDPVRGHTPLPSFDGTPIAPICEARAQSSPASDPSNASRIASAR